MNFQKDLLVNYEADFGAMFLSFCRPVTIFETLKTEPTDYKNLSQVY